MQQGAVSADGQQQLGSVGKAGFGDPVNISGQPGAQRGVHQHAAPTGVQVVGDIRHQRGDAFVVGTAHKGDGLEHAGNLQ